MSLLRVENLWVAVPAAAGGARAVVRDCSFTVPRGEVTCIVGESGSGKTVLVRSLLGISEIRPGVTRGQAWAAVGEHEVPLLPACRSRSGRALPQLRPGWAGYVFQHPGESLDPLQPVGRQLRWALHSAPQAGSSVASLLADVGLDADVARRWPHELSGGMAQRVAVALALATEPELLVADEPTTGLDWSLRRDIVDLLKGLCQRRAMTLLLISHDFAVVEHAADRVLVMFQGDLVEHGPRRAFFEEGPGRHPYTADLQARVEALADGLEVEPPRGSGAPAAGGGCRYAERCVLATGAGASELAERCRTTAPMPSPVEAGHDVACHLASGCYAPPEEIFP